jgi:glycosyltransferase involved in cell wall biosynthesis
VERIRVVHIIHSMEVGGAQRQIASLFGALDRARFDLRLICLGRKGVVGEQLEREGFVVAALGKKARVQIGMLMRLVRLLREWKPGIVHCSIFTANLWGRIAGKIAGVPILIAHEQSTISLEKWYRRLIDRVLSRITWRVLTVSEDLRRRVVAEEGIAPARVEVLHNAIDLRAIAAGGRADAAGGRADAREQALAGERGLRVGVVGRLEHRKDHLTLVRAAARVVSEIPAATFFLVGEGPDRPKIEAEIARLRLRSSVFLLGERHDVPELLHSFDVYVLSSITEGLSLSILEAMAAGCPVVATDVGGNPELLDDGRAGILTPARDPEALALAVIRLLKSPAQRETLAQAARQRALEGFDIHSVARRLQALYERAVLEKG